MALALMIAGPVVAGCSQPTGQSFTPVTEGELCVATARPAPGFWEGDDGGLEGAFAGLLAERLDLDDVRVVDVPLSELAGGVPDGCDVALAQLVPTDERKEVAAWSSAYLRADLGIVVAGDLAVPDVSTARELRWGAEQSSSGADVLRDALPTAAVRDYPDLDALLAAVEAAEVDAAVLDLPVALVEASERPALRVASRFARSDQYAVEIRDADQRDALDRALRSLVAQGVLDDLVERWLEPRYAQDPDTVPALRTRDLP
ncbi:MAG: transporter substrate-binding domain-containing protein [Actinomycetota bacterium]|nr:transporter substrate-binding domain-containing protein [Actinomycetota bacterium]